MALVPSRLTSSNWTMIVRHFSLQHGLWRNSGAATRMWHVNKLTWRSLQSRYVYYSGLRRSCITEARAEVSGTWFRQQCAIESHVPKSRASHIHIRGQITCPLTSAFASVMQDLRNPLYLTGTSLFPRPHPSIKAIEFWWPGNTHDKNCRP